MKTLLFGIMVVLAFIPIANAQNGTRLIGFDAVTIGRGGTSTAVFDNPSLMMNNPGGLAFIKKPQADISFSLMAPGISFKNSLNDKQGDKNLFPLGSISYAKPVTSKITYAVGIFTQGGMGADFTLNHDLYRDANGQFITQPYHSKFAVMQGGASLAYKMNHQLAIGVTANLVYGQVEFQMPMSMPPAMLKGVINPTTGQTFGDLFSLPNESGGLGYSEMVASANMRGLKDFGFNGKIGIAYKPNDQLSFGLNYTLPLDMTYKKGTADMDMNTQMNNAFGRVVSMILQSYPGTTPDQARQMAMTMFGQMGIDLAKGAADHYNASAEFGLPQSIAAGISYTPVKKLRLALDAEWINWEKAFDQMDISLNNGTNPNINRMLGTEGTIQMPFPLQWKNTMVIRTGLEYDACKKITLRAGYIYGGNPVPSSTIFPVFPAIVTDHLTGGLTVKLSKAVFFNGAYEYAFEKKQTADAHSLIGAQFNNSTSGLNNNIYHLSLSWQMK